MEPLTLLLLASLTGTPTQEQNAWSALQNSEMTDTHCHAYDVRLLDIRERLTLQTPPKTNAPECVQFCGEPTIKGGK